MKPTWIRTNRRFILIAAGLSLLTFFAFACSNDEPGDISDPTPPDTIEPPPVVDPIPPDMMEPPSVVDPTPPDMTPEIPVMENPLAMLNGFSRIGFNTMAIQEFSDNIDPETTKYYAEFVTQHGNFTAELYPDCSNLAAPIFMYLAQNGYYDNTTFHRVIPGFVVQGGDPTGTGSGSPGFAFADPSCPERRHDSAGVLSFANAGFDSNGSQFFVTLGATPHLDTYRDDGTIKQCTQPGTSCHPVFGRVISGFNETVLKINERNPATANTDGDLLITINIMEQNDDGDMVPLSIFVPNNNDVTEFVENFDYSETYTATFETSSGNFVADLYDECSPIATPNFIYLASNGFYDNTPFNAVLLGTAIQAGDPGSGEPRYRFGDASCADYTHASEGIISMVNAGGFNTNGSQFWITVSNNDSTSRRDIYDADGLPKMCTEENVSCFPIIGQITAGFEVVKLIEADEGTFDRSEPVRLLSVTISSD